MKTMTTDPNRYRSYFDDRQDRQADEEDLDYAYESLDAVLATSSGDSGKLAEARKMVKDAYHLALDAIDDFYQEVT